LNPLVGPDKTTIAAMTARMMLEARAVQYNADQPFFLASGWASPVYIDCQRLISYPRIRGALMDFATGVLVRDVGFEQFDTVAGVEATGIAYAAWIAERLSLPMQTVRAKPKGFGREAQIEGALRRGARVLLVDDLTTDGRSKIELCRALRAAEAHVAHVFVMFFYDIFPETRALLGELGIALHFLANWSDVLREAKRTEYFAPEAAEEVEKFLRDPARWSIEHGGIGIFPRG